MRVLSRIDGFLYVVALCAGVYVAAAGPLNSKGWPDDGVWEPWEPLFVGLIGAGAYLALFTYYKQLESRASRATTRNADATLICQQMAWRIASECPGIELSALAVSFWVCRTRGRFDRSVRFYLPGVRPPSGVQWKKGKGAAGWLWEQGQDRAIAAKLQGRNAMKKITFDQEPARRRLGLSYDEWQLVKNYTAVYALKEYGTASDGPLGMLVIDYSERLVKNASGADQLDRIKLLVQNDHVFGQYRGAIVKRLAG